MSGAELVQAPEAYDALSKPCLVHCSAGAYRTGAVVEAILARHAKLRFKIEKPPSF